MSCKFMNVHQALSYLEGLCQSENAEDGLGSSFFFSNICIQPPDDVQSESDKDSGDEEALQFSNLGCRQLLAAANLEVHDETGRRVVGANNNNEVKEVVQIGSRKRRRMTSESRIPYFLDCKPRLIKFFFPSCLRLKFKGGLHFFCLAICC